MSDKEINLDDLDFDGFEDDEENEPIEMTEEAENSSDESKEEISLEDLMGVEEKVEEETDDKPKNTKKKSSSKKATPKIEKKKYTGKRTIIVYGDKLWVEEDPEVTEEQIRQRIVEEFGYSEFKKNVLFDLDEEDGTLCVGKSFQKKG